MASCAHFDPICAHWTDESLHELFFEHLYVPPHGIPTFEAMAERYGDRGVHVMQSISKADPKENRANRLGKHKGLTQIGIIFDGLISPGGDIFSQDVFIADMTRDVLVQEGKSRHYANTYEAGLLLPIMHVNLLMNLANSQYAMCNQSAIPETDVVHVKEIAYIHHLHQMMFWHWLMDEWYRVFHFVPFLQRHVDIPIFVHSSSGFVERADTLNGRMFQVLNISQYASHSLHQGWHRAMGTDSHSASHQHATDRCEVRQGRRHLLRTTLGSVRSGLAPAHAVGPIQYVESAWDQSALERASAPEQA